MSDELDNGARSLLDACRNADALPMPVRARVWQRVERDVAAPVATTASVSWLKPGLAALALAAGVAALWFGSDALRAQQRVAVGAAEYQRVGATTIPETALEQATPAQIETAVIPAELPSDDVVPASDTTPVEPPAARPRSTRPPARRDEISTDVTPAKIDAVIADPLTDELTRLRSAQATLRTAPKQTLVMLAALDRDHPRGVLGPERDALRVFALCASGDASGARARAATFETRHASSPLLARVRTSCAAEEKSPPP